MITTQHRLAQELTTGSLDQPAVRNWYIDFDQSSSIVINNIVYSQSEVTLNSITDLNTNTLLNLDDYSASLDVFYTASGD